MIGLAKDSPTQYSGRVEQQVRLERASNEHLGIPSISL